MPLTTLIARADLQMVCKQFPTAIVHSLYPDAVSGMDIPCRFVRRDFNHCILPLHPCSLPWLHLALKVRRSGTRRCRQIRNAAGARACHGYHACVRMRDEDEIPASANLKPRNIQSSVDLDDAYTSYKEVVASSHGNVLEFPRDLTAVIECACTITYVCPL
jgi:hypothetical protein